MCSRSRPASMRLMLRSVSANKAATPSSNSEKLTWPTNRRLDHLRVLRPCADDELEREFMLVARLVRVNCQAGKKLKAIRVAKKRAAAKANNCNPGCKSSGDRKS